MDFGGGTTSLLLARAAVGDGAGRLTDVLTYAERYGGSDFDIALAYSAAAELGVPLEPAMLPDWRARARDWKEQLSARLRPFEPRKSERAAATGAFRLRGGESGTVEFTVQADEFATLAQDLIERFGGVLERGLSRFEVGAGEIARVVLAGGGARWHFTPETVHALLPGARILEISEPETLVSRGLALAPLTVSRPIPVSIPVAAPPIPSEAPASSAPLLPPGAVDAISLAEPPEPIAPPATVVMEDAPPPEPAPPPAAFAPEAAYRLIPAMALAAELPKTQDDPLSAGNDRAPFPNRDTPNIPRAEAPARAGGAEARELPAAPSRGVSGVTGEDFAARVLLTLQEAKLGGRKIVDVAGWSQIIAVPPNVSEGDRRVYPGQGHPGRSGGASGDLNVTFSVKPERSSSPASDSRMKPAAPPSRPARNPSRRAPARSLRRRPSP